MKAIAVVNNVLMICYLFGGTIGYLNRPTKISQSGLIFLKSNDIIITDDSWTIVLALNASQHLDNAIYLKKKVKSLEGQFGINDPEMKRLTRVTDELVEVNKAMNDVLNKKRIFKRFYDHKAEYDTKIIFNFGSSADAEEMKKILGRLNKLENDQEIKNRLLQEHISFTEVLDKKVKENTKRILDLTEEVEKEIHRTEAKFKHIDANLKQLNYKLDYIANMSSTFRLMHAEGLHSLLAANRLQHALEMAGEGKLSFYLLSPRELQNELISISSLLPFGSKLFRGVSVEDMYTYREMAMVAVMANSQQIFITIRLPLLSSNSGFSLYTVNALPIFNDELEVAMKVEPESNYVIVSDDQQYYALPDAEYISRCYGRQPMICPADVTLLNREVPTCVGSSYFSNTWKLGATCNKKVILSGEDSVWLADRQNDGWIYSLMNSTRLTLHCGVKTIETNLLKGIGKLVNSNHCTIFGDKFKLLRRNSGGVSIRSSAGVQILQQIDVNKLPPIFTIEELVQVADKTKIKLAIDEIKQNKRIKKETRRIIELPMDMLLRNAYSGDNNDIKGNEESLEHHHHHIKLDSISGIILFVVCVVTSTVTSLIAVIIFMYVCGGRLQRQYYPIGTTTIIERNNIDAPPTEPLYPPSVAQHQLHQDTSIPSIKGPNNCYINDQCLVGR